MSINEYEVMWLLVIFSRLFFYNQKLILHNVLTANPGSRYNCIGPSIPTDCFRRIGMSLGRSECITKGRTTSLASSTYASSIHYTYRYWLLSGYGIIVALMFQCITRPWCRKLCLHLQMSPSDTVKTDLEIVGVKIFLCNASVFGDGIV